MSKINAIIIEDSRLARNELKELLKYHPQIQLLAEAENVDQAFELINSQRPDLIFLDINLRDGNAFDFLEQVGSLDFQVIFITAYEEYALQQTTV